MPSALVAASVRIRQSNISGSGVCLASQSGYSFVLTNAHVVGYSPVVQVDWPGKATYSGNVINRDEERDLAAVLVVTPKVMPSVKLSRKHPVRGVQIVQIGYPGGRGPAAKFGQVYGYDIAKGFRKRNMLLSFQTISGDSGSGVFDRSTNEVIGIVWAKTDRGPFAGHGAAVELEDVRHFVESCFLKRPWLKKPQQPTDPPIYWPPAKPDTDKLEGKLSDIEKQIEALRKLSEEMGALAKKIGEPPKEPETEPPGKKPASPKESPAAEDSKGKTLAIAKEVAGFSWPWVLGALGIGGVGGATVLPLAIKGVSALIKRRKKVAGTSDDKLAGLKDSIVELIKSRTERTEQTEPATLPTSSPVAEPTQEPKSQTEMKFVPYAGSNEELDALNEAMEKFAQDFPGSVSMLERLRSYAKQILSGKKR